MPWFGDDFAFRICDTQLNGFSPVVSIPAPSKTVPNFVFQVFCEIILTAKRQSPG